MKNRRQLFSLLAAAFLFCAGCSNLPGRPAPNSIPIDPDNITDFNILYKQNCSGCHGAEGKGGAALSLGDPVYLAVADDTTLRKVVTNGIGGTSMAAFAKSAGGMLTDNQVDIIVRGLRERYSKPSVLAGATPPPYTATEPGDATRGAAVYETFCSSCHGPAGKGGPKASSIVDGSFLALLTDQELRTLVIVGRPDLGAPDWRNNVPGKPMSSQEISDVVAWLSAQRPQFPGRPYPHAAKPAGELP
jgi:cytochrome c oxidase cbb3-type subunit III